MMKYVLILTAALAACNASEPQATPQPQASQTATIAKKVILIDVRSPEEFQAGHLANAHNITHDQIDKKNQCINRRQKMPKFICIVAQVDALVLHWKH